jgi:hypothetical protein
LPCHFIGDAKFQQGRLTEYQSLQGCLSNAGLDTAATDRTGYFTGFCNGHPATCRARGSAPGRRHGGQCHSFASLPPGNGNTQYVFQI